MENKKQPPLAPPNYRIYPGSTPEFRIVKKSDGTLEHQVRYIKSDVGYTGLWMKVSLEEKS